MAELAAAVGVAPDTVRYYERAGLIAPPRRTPSGYRSYDRREIDRLQFLRGSQRLGLRLREIKDLLAVRDTGVCPCEPAEELLSRRLTEVDEEIARLTALRAELADLLTRLPDGDVPDLEPGTWCPPAEHAETKGGDCCE